MLEPTVDVFDLDIFRPEHAS